MLWLAWKRRISLATVTLVLALASFALNLYATGSSQVAAFYSPQSRFWGVAGGGLACIRGPAQGWDWLPDRAGNPGPDGWGRPGRCVDGRGRRAARRAIHAGCIVHCHRHPGDQPGKGISRMVGAVADPGRCPGDFSRPASVVQSSGIVQPTAGLVWPDQLSALSLALAPAVIRAHSGGPDARPGSLAWRRASSRSCWLGLPTS